LLGDGCDSPIVAPDAVAVESVGELVEFANIGGRFWQIR